MSKGEALRDFVKERLTAAAEEIFAQFERTIAEYEEELRRSKVKNQGTRELESALNPRVVLFPTAVKSPGPGLNHGPNQEIPETSQIKDEEQMIKQEEEHLPVSVPESSAVCVKTDKSSQLQQTKDLGAERYLHSETERDMVHSSDSDNFEDWRGPLRCAEDGEHDQVQIRTRKENKSGPETGDMSRTAEGVEGKLHQCLVYKKSVKGSKQNLLHPMRIHTERPYSLQKTFCQKTHLNAHNISHTDERPFSCSICKKEFTKATGLKHHMRTHTGERPFSCSFCSKTFSLKSNLRVHLRIHTGERPYSCSTCNKTFSRPRDLHNHVKMGERPCVKTGLGPGLNPGLDQEIPETSQIKEEPEKQSVKQEDEHLQVSVPECSAVCVKTEESSLLRQTGHKQEETWEENVRAEPHLHSESERDTKHSSYYDLNEEWRALLRCAEDSDHNNKVQIRVRKKYKSGPETSVTVNNGDMSGTAEGAEGKMHQCPICKKKLKGGKKNFKRHLRIHTGERPYSCLVCQKTFSRLDNLNNHIRKHTGAKPWGKRRLLSSPGLSLNRDLIQQIPETSQIKDEPEKVSIKQEEEHHLQHHHLQVSVPEFSAVCVNTEESSLLRQTEQEETHEEDVSAETHLHSETESDTDHSSYTDNDEDWRAPLSCAEDGDHDQVQSRTRKYKSGPETSAAVNTGDMSGTAEGDEGKTQHCPVCKKRLKGKKQNLLLHMRIHTGERPYSCSICQKTFSRLHHLNNHRKTHTGEKRKVESLNKSWAQSEPWSEPGSSKDRLKMSNKRPALAESNMHWEQV